MTGALERERRSHLAGDPVGPWIPTATGRKVSIREPLKGQISIRDIAARLAKQCRFVGEPGLFYSVAQHNVAVSEMFAGPTEATYALLNNAHEAYLGHLTPQVKEALTQGGHLGRYGTLAERFDHAIHMAIGINPEMPYGLDSMIWHADRVQLATELRDVVPGTGDGWGPLPDPRPRPIVPMRWDKAEDLFLRRFRELCALTGLDPENSERPVPPAFPSSPFQQGVSP